MRKLTESDKSLIALSLRLAAERYAEFVAISGLPQLSKQFKQQQVQAIEIAVAFENDEVTL